MNAPTTPGVVAGQLVQRFRCAGCAARFVQPHGQPTPTCACGGVVRWTQTAVYHPPAPRFGRAPAIDFAPSRDRELPLDGPGGAPVFMESLHQLRRIERESEKRAADGVGEALRFRMYSQDASQRHENTFGTPPHRAPSQAWLAKHGGALRESLRAPEEAGEMGPGAEEALASALPSDV
jgi:hypothetical protein